MNVDTVDAPNPGQGTPPDENPAQDGEAETDASQPPMHKSCEHRAPSPLPPPPPVHSDASGRPTFDLWRSECGFLDYPACTLADPVECTYCAESKERVTCVVGLAAQDCLADEVVVGFQGGRCHACATRENKARACCNKVEGIDCRAWPYDQNPSAPGELCARHTDCQEGLVCKGGRDGYGVCMCPETDAEAERDPVECYGVIL